MENTLPGAEDLRILCVWPGVRQGEPGFPATPNKKSALLKGTVETVHFDTKTARAPDSGQLGFHLDSATN